jgi:hypothetical protein
MRKSSQWKGLEIVMQRSALSLARCPGDFLTQFAAEAAQLCTAYILVDRESEIIEGKIANLIL